MTEEDLQAVADTTADVVGIRFHPKVTVKSVKRGRASYVTNRITIPLWATSRVEEYAIYYTVHEVAHFAHIDEGHSDEFKETEQRVLDEWGIGIDYKRAYPKALYANGVKVCGKHGVNEDVR